MKRETKYMNIFTPCIHGPRLPASCFSLRFYKKVNVSFVKKIFILEEMNKIILYYVANKKILYLYNFS